MPGHFFVLPRIRRLWRECVVYEQVEGLSTVAEAEALFDQVG
jgi:hypothetical protein